MTSGPAPRRFGALRDRGPRGYLVSAGLSMLGDNTEHVLTYWVLWERFHSPVLVGFEVISHWLPFLLLSVPFGTLAERHDCRRLIQAAQLLFMAVSACWGVLFLTGSLQLWEACALLVLHGTAGALWSPAEQLLLHDFAGPGELTSVIRLNATFRGLGTLCGPVVGSALLFGLGPTTGIFVNVAAYVPMTLLLLRTRVTGHTSDPVLARRPASVREVVAVLGAVAHDRVLVGMIALSACIALLVGASLQVSMPAIAADHGAAAGPGYGLLLFANGIGGVVGGFVLEATGWTRPTTRWAATAAGLFGATTLVTALAPGYLTAVLALVVGGVANLASQSITQAVVQLRAPADQRGRVVGLFSTFGQGFRTGNGIVLAALGSAIGIVPAVAAGGAVLLAAAAAVGCYARGRD